MAMQRPTSTPPYSITGLNPHPLIGWWYSIAAPKAPPNAETLPLREREFLRRGKLTSIALLIEFIEMLIAIGAGIQDPNKALLPILFSIITVLIIATALNRFRRLTPAGILVIIVVIGGMVGNIMGSPHGQLGTYQLPLLCLLAQPLMISVLLFPAWGIPLVGAFNALLITSFLLFMPKTAELQFYLQTQPYVVYSVPLTIQVVISLISYIVITSLQESMIRADRAEEIGRLMQELANLQQGELDQKERLEASIRAIQDVHMRVANGDMRARVSYHPENILWPLAGNLNNLLNRLQRAEQQSQQLQQAQSFYAALQGIAAQIQRDKQKGHRVKLYPTGTGLDRVILEISQADVSAFGLPSASQQEFPSKSSSSLRSKQG